MPPKQEYPRSCSTCLRTYSSRQSFCNHRTLGICHRAIANIPEMSLIPNWRKPDIPEAVLHDVVDVLNNTSGQAFPALFAKIYFNDSLPQNKVIKFRNKDIPFGMIMAIDKGVWTPHDAGDFFETLDEILHETIERIKAMANQHNINLENFVARIEAHNKRRQWKKQKEYVSVITTQCYYPPSLIKKAYESKPVQLIQNWDELADINSIDDTALMQNLSTALKEDFEKMTAILDGNTTKGKLLDFQAKDVYPRVVRSLYFDPKAPEHRVIKLRNIAVSSGAVMVMENGTWQEKNQKEFLPKLYEVVKAVLCQVYNTFSDMSYSVDNYFIADENLKKSGRLKTHQRELNDAVLYVIMAGDSRDIPKPIKKPPPPMRFAKKENDPAADPDAESAVAGPPPKSMTEIRKEFATLPKDGKELAHLRQQGRRFPVIDSDTEMDE